MTPSYFSWGAVLIRILIKYLLNIEEKDCSFNNHSLRWHNELAFLLANLCFSFFFFPQQVYTLYQLLLSVTNALQSDSELIKCCSKVLTEKDSLWYKNCILKIWGLRSMLLCLTRSNSILKTAITVTWKV